MVTDKVTKLPSTSDTANLFGLYLDNGRTELNLEYSDSFESRAYWYDNHYQFKGGYRNEGFVLGHPDGTGKRRALFLGITHPITDSIVPSLYFVHKAWRSESDQLFRENDLGLSVDLFGKRGEKLAISYENRVAEGSDVNNILILDMLYRF